MARIRIRPRAAADLEEIYDYLVLRNVAAADHFAEAASADFDRLAEMPRLGAPRQARNPSLSGLRSWPMTGFRNYLIFYLPIEDGVEVIRVYHGARNIDRLLDRE